MKRGVQVAIALATRLREKKTVSQVASVWIASLGRFVYAHIVYEPDTARRQRMFIDYLNSVDRTHLH